MKQCPYCVQEIADKARKCHYCGEWIDEGIKEKGPRNELVDSLYKKQVADELRDGVEKSLKKKYAWLGLLVFVLSGGGITLLVNNILSGAQTNVAVAEALQKRSIKTLDELDKSIKKIDQFTTSIERIEKRAQALENRYSAVENFSKGSLEVSSSLKQEISNLNKIVRDLAKLQEVKSPAIQDILSNVDNIDKGLAVSKKKIKKSEKQIDLAKYPVLVRHFKEGSGIADKIISTFRNIGYQTGYYKDGIGDESLEQNQSIAIGRNVPLNIAIEVIETAIKEAPFLNYIRFSTSDSDGIVVGASTERSKDFGVQPFTKQELVKLIDKTQTQQEFHDKILQFYVK